MLAGRKDVSPRCPTDLWLGFILVSCERTDVDFWHLLPFSHMPWWMLMLRPKLHHRRYPTHKYQLYPTTGAKLIAHPERVYGTILLQEFAIVDFLVVEGQICSQGSHIFHFGIWSGGCDNLHPMLRWPVSIKPIPREENGPPFQLCKLDYHATYSHLNFKMLSSR